MSAQLSFFSLSAGEHARDAGIQQAIRNNERFIDIARGVARYLAGQRSVVNTDDVREILDFYGVEPKHPNAWGAVFRAKEWEVVGHKASEIPSNHSRRIFTYRLAV